MHFHFPAAVSNKKAHSSHCYFYDFLWINWKHLYINFIIETQACQIQITFRVTFACNLANPRCQVSARRTSNTLSPSEEPELLHCSASALSRSHRILKHLWLSVFVLRQVGGGIMGNHRMRAEMTVTSRTALKNAETWNPSWKFHYSKITEHMFLFPIMYNLCQYSFMFVYIFGGGLKKSTCTNMISLKNLDCCWYRDSEAFEAAH